MDHFEYLRLLEERKRLEKQLKSKNPSALEERERGFSVYFDGANNEKVRKKRTIGVHGRYADEYESLSLMPL